MVRPDRWLAARCSWHAAGLLLLVVTVGCGGTKGGGLYPAGQGDAASAGDGAGGGLELDVAAPDAGGGSDAAAPADGAVADDAAADSEALDAGAAADTSGGPDDGGAPTDGGVADDGGADTVGSDASDVAGPDAAADAAPSDVTGEDGAAPGDVASPVAPTVSFLSPADGATVQGQVALSLAVDDDLDGVSVAVSVDGDLLTTLDGPPYEAVWDATAVTGGSYVLSAEATDVDGLIASAQVQVTVVGACSDAGDCPPYNVKLINPVAGSVVCGLVTLEAIAEDDHGVAEIELLVDGASLGVDQAPPYQRDWDTTAVADGAHDVKVIARDTIGQGTFQTVTLTVDNGAGACDNLPSVTITSPAGGAHVKGDVPLEASASDDNGVVKVQFFVDNKLVVEDPSFPYKHVWASDEVDEGTYTLKAVAFDVAGQKAQAQISFTVDRTSPVVTIVAPGEGALVGDSFPFAATASDPGLASVALQAGGQAPVVLVAPPFEATMNVAALPSGPLTLTAVATDKAGNAMTAVRGLTLDRPPVVTLLQPKVGATLAGEVVLSAAATDDVAIVDLSWTLDGLPLGGGGPFGGTAADSQVTLDTTELLYGPHSITVSATDSVGQVATMEAGVTVDQPLAVTLVLCAPAGGCSVPPPATELAGPWSLQLVAKDDNGKVTSVLFEAGAKVLGTAQASPWVQAVDTTALSDGPITFEATATSSLGIQATATLSAVINNCDKDHDGAQAVACGGNDCDDQVTAWHPGASDAVGDGVDQNCDGADGVDADGDGHAALWSGGDDCDDKAPQTWPGHADQVGDGVDQSCDGVDGIDGDADGYASVASGGQDCDDALPSVHPNAPDSLGDGVDQDCDGADGHFCTGPADCVDGDPCTDDVCVSETGQCHWPLNAAPCDDGDACTTGDTCQAGLCGGAPVVCPPGGSPNDACCLPCTTIAELRALPEGPITATLCASTVTYVFDAGYFMQQGPDGPATEVYVAGAWAYAPPTPGDVLTLTALTYTNFNGQQEITDHEPPTLVGTASLAGWALDLTSGVVLSEDLESRLVTGKGLTITGTQGGSFLLETAPGVQVSMFADNVAALPKALCVGAVFDLEQAVVTDYLGTWQVRVFDAAVDIANIDDTGCSAEPVYDDSNWGFEDWSQSDPPQGFGKVTAGFTATQETGQVYAGAASVNLTWTSQDNQDFMALMHSPVAEGASVTASAWIYDADPNGRARLGLAFYGPGKVFLANAYATSYTTDTPLWASYTFTTVVPAGAAFVRPFVRLYDQNGFATVGSATVYLDDLTLQSP